MSHIPSSGGVVFNFLPNIPTTWWYHDLRQGWQGNTFIQAQPHNTDAPLVCVPGAIEKQSDGSYKFFTTITNHGVETDFTFQVSED
jgi:hypothetical protein